MAHRRFGHIVAWALIIVHLVVVCGCSSTSRITLPANEVPVDPNLKIATAILKNGDVVDFDGKAGMYIDKHRDGTTHRVIVGTSHGKQVELDPDNVLEVRFEQSTADGSGNFLVGLLIGVPIGAGLLMFIFVLSYGGN